MGPELCIYLADLTHTSQGYASELVPYAIGCIAEYAEKHSELKLDITLFKDPAQLNHSLTWHVPDVMAFSHYIWNHSLVSHFAKRIKKIHPSVLTVAGGPHFPIDIESQKQWLDVHPQIDMYVTGEGEIPFSRLLSIFAETGNILDTKVTSHPGIHAKSKYGYTFHEQEFLRISELADIPSPYLSGRLDTFLEDTRLIPLLECARGCPFSCTFCIDGLANRNKVYRHSVDRLTKEVIYIAQHTSSPTLFLSDANFGMYKEDILFAEKVQLIREKTGYPQYINTSTGKNNKERVIEVTKKLKGALRVAASVQSMDNQVLHNIQRKNISVEKLTELSWATGGAAHTYSEIILGLPGDSLDKHIKGICQLIDMGFDQIRMHQFILLPGSLAASPVYRERYGIRGRWRILQRCFGEYEILGEDIPIIEMEEVAAESSSMSLEDYLYCRTFALTVALFYNERILGELSRYIKGWGIDYSLFLQYVHRFVWSLDKEHPLHIGYTLFKKKAEDEFVGLLNDEQKRNLVHKGEIGQNLLLNTQGKILYHHLSELIETAFDWAAAFLARRVFLNTDNLFLMELKRFCQLKKDGLKELEWPKQKMFSYDFLAWEKDDRQLLSEGEYMFEFYYTQEQQAFFQHQLDLYGTSEAGLGKLIARSPMKQISRMVRRVP